MSNESARTLGTGSIVAGRYRIESVIGTGGMAVVYRAVDEELGRPVALKVFREGVVDAAGVKRQAEEIRLIASLDHPALVTLFDAVPSSEGDEHATGVLVMQLVEGHDLRHRIAEDGQLPPETVAAIAADIAGALAYVHGQGIIHRDVAPANVLLPAEHEPGAPIARLADFGIARLIDSAGLTATGSVIGTAMYMSPEQAEGKLLAPSSDIYSLGLTLLEALTGERAFPGTAVESAMARLTSDPAVPDTLGTGWRALIVAMTSREPAARPTAAEVVAAARDVERGGTGALPATKVLPAAGLPAAVVPTAVVPTAILPEAETEQLGSTKLLPAAGLGATAGLDKTELLVRDDVVPPKKPGRTPLDPARRRAIVIVAVLLAAMIAVVAVVNALGFGSPSAAPPATSTTPSSAPSVTPSAQPAAPPDYPAVAGKLGGSLGELQSAVGDPAIDEELAAQLQQLVLDVTTSSAAGEFESAKDQLETLRRTVDEARASGTLDETSAETIRAAIDGVNKSLDDAIHDANGKGPGKGPKGKEG